MKIAFLHYHLKPGGVTSVIRQQVHALEGEDRLVVLSGEAPVGGAFPCPVQIIPSLAYDGQPQTDQPPAATAERIEQALQRVFDGPCDLIHVHNPTLVKNRQILKVLGVLRERGHPLFLQIHDFAEDGRPEAYDGDTPYPSDCHYGVINLRDASILLKAGFAAQGVHHLPNAIVPLATVPSGSAGGDVLYPVRAIRRKNIGEVCLLAVLQPKQARLMITLPPTSAADLPSYRDWKHYVAGRRLPVVFDAGVGCDFGRLMARARHVVSTSIAEGFGFVFLEPWTAGKCLWGRQLPEICQDFIDNGLDLDHLYTQLILPQAWIGSDVLQECFRRSYARNRRRFGAAAAGLPPPDDFLRRLQASEWIDFGLLDEPLQRVVLEGLQRYPQRIALLHEANPILAAIGNRQWERSRLARNCAAVRAHYGLASYRQGLRRVYGAVLHRPVAHRIDKSRILNEFVKFNNYSLLKWNPYPDA